MRKFTLSAAAVMLSMTAFTANAHNITVDHQADQKKVYLTFEDYSAVTTGLYMNNYTSTATLNGTDVSFNIMPLLNEAEEFINTIYFDYMMYFPALANGGMLPDGEYTLTFNEGYLYLDYVANEEPISVNFTVGDTPTAIESLGQSSAAQTKVWSEGRMLIQHQGVTYGVNGSRVK